MDITLRLAWRNLWRQPRRTWLTVGAMVFSNIITLVQPDVPHPIQAELERGRFQLVKKLQRKVKPPPEPDGSRRRTREKVEVWELSLT